MVQKLWISFTAECRWRWMFQGSFSRSYGWIRRVLELHSSRGSSSTWNHRASQRQVEEHTREDCGLNTMHFIRRDWSCDRRRCVRQELCNMVLRTTAIRSCFWQDPTSRHGLHQRLKRTLSRFHNGWSTTTFSHDAVWGHEGHSRILRFIIIAEGTAEEDQSWAHLGPRAGVTACILAVDYKISSQTWWVSHCSLPWKRPRQHITLATVRVTNSEGCTQPSATGVWLWTVCANTRRC